MTIKTWVIGIAIMIVAIFVVVYGINTFYPSPQFNDFCNEDNFGKLIDNETSCVADGGKWFPNPAEPLDNGKIIEGYCDLEYYCRQDYDDASKARSRIIFFIALPLGIIIIALGAFLFSLEAVGAGIMGGGVGTILYGIGGYWNYTENWLRFLLSLIGLVILIFFAYWMNKKYKKKHN